jgi:hypothetical protein
MTGVITEIKENAEYSGERRLFGTVEEVNRYLTENPDEAEHIEFSLEDLDESLQAMDRGKEKAKEKRERGPSSHIVTVRFGEGDHGFEIPFGTLSEVGSLMTAYVVTCHKMQGGEAPVVVILCHDSHRAMLYREWLYTAVTRASEKCILLYKEDALRTALNKQKMPGKTLKEKVLSFNAAQNITIEGVNVSRDVRLPESTSTRNRILDRKDELVVTPARLTTQAEREGGLAQLLKKKVQPKPEPEVIQKVEVKHTFTINIQHESERVKEAPSPDISARQPQVDGGDLTPERKTPPQVEAELPTLPKPVAPQLPDGVLRMPETPFVKSLSAPVAIPQPWFGHWMLNASDRKDSAQRLLPAPIEQPKKVFKFGVKK